MTTHHRVEGELQSDGSLLFQMDVAPGATTVEIAGHTWGIPTGASRIHVRVSTSDAGETTVGVRPSYEEDTTT